MKIKRLPEDFRVEERTSVLPSDRGDYALYRLTKQGIGTPEAVDALAHRWNLPRERFSFGGLKDRHALSAQHLTILQGPRRGCSQTNLKLDYLGSLERPFTPKDISGNRFRIVLRSLATGEIPRSLRALEEARCDGLPNYFDDQRFGSLGASGEFIARPWIAGNFERALWLALAEPNEHDRPEDRDEKKTLRNEWGKWTACKEKLGRSHRRSIVTYLCDKPADFKGAFARIRKDLRSLYLAAFQSDLWNRILAAFLRSHFPADRLISVSLKAGEFPFFPSPDPGTAALLRSASLPLPSSRTRIDDASITKRVESVLNDRGLTLKSLRVRHPKDNFFSKGWRNAIVSPEGLTWEEGSDELYSGRRKLTLSFDLPRGSYATILVKRITTVAGASSSDPLESD